MIFLSSVLILFTLWYTAYPQLVTFDRYSCVESLYFCPAVPCISHTDFVILSGVLRRKAIINNSRHRNNSLLQYLSLLLIIHANDVNLNPGPTHNDTVHDRDYLCGTCDRLVDWEDRGVNCEIGIQQWMKPSTISTPTVMLYGPSLTWRETELCILVLTIGVMCPMGKAWNN